MLCLSLSFALTCCCLFSIVVFVVQTKLEAIRTDIHHQNAKNQQQFMAIIASLNQLVSKAHKDKQKAAQIGASGLLQAFHIELPDAKPHL